MYTPEWTASEWAKYSRDTGLSRADNASNIFKTDPNDVREDFLPSNILIRESRDTKNHPNSTPIIIGLDVTGSMDRVLKSIAQKALPVLIESIYKKMPVSDPNVMFMAIGDHETDSFPIQVTNFEFGIEIAQQLQDLYMERGGGSNNGEGYSLAWAFASMKTSIDSMEKRKKKGFLFTMGDEKFLETVSGDVMRDVLGISQGNTMDSISLLKMAERMYNVYHLIIDEGRGIELCRDFVYDQWKNALGQNAISVVDYTMIGEIITSILQVNAGHKKEEIIKGWDKSCQLAVSTAIHGLSTGRSPESETGIVKF